MANIEPPRRYRRDACIAFRKTNEQFGGLSNMAPGFPLRVNRVNIRTSEALYQACRFPHRPDLQRIIIEQKSPVTAKMKSRLFHHDSRSDWNEIRITVMRWCLRVKLVQNWKAFSSLLLRTGEQPIVEESGRDRLWGATPLDEANLIGYNILGRLLMELREEIRLKAPERITIATVPDIPCFLLFGRPITPIHVPSTANYSKAIVHARNRPDNRHEKADHPTVRQGTLFALDDYD